MSNNARDEQFAGFAKAVLGKMRETGMSVYVDADGFTHKMLMWEDVDYAPILAHAAYDLVAHTLTMVPHLMHIVPDAQSIDVVMPYIPDMPTLPEEKSE